MNVNAGHEITSKARIIHQIQLIRGITSGFNVAFWCTDGYRAYNDELPQAKNIVGKLYTQRIERENLTLRNRLKRLNRKTLGYSKSSEMHDRIIGTFIEREYYV
ncbi:hypothetical protein EEI76_23040 (plasmid) [Enterobacter cloacae]|nr:hypothetical protein EEI76_23040 [Enterobacter cloacae]